MRRTTLLLLLVLAGFATAQQGARYLIITTDALASAVAPLADWKHASGMMCQVTKLSQTGSDTTSIKNYIRNAYNNWQIKPEFVLLVGAPSALPSRDYYTQQGHRQNYDFSSDNIYGDMTGDFRMEIPVGRFPAKSAAQLDVMVTKTLTYERWPDVSDTNWMRRLTTIVREDYDSDDTIYWNNVRYAASLARQAGFVGCDSLSRARGDTATHIVASIDRGTGLVLYRGTAVSNWYKPFNVAPQNTNNGKKLPVILSITCETMTLAANESMVGDAWLKTGTLGNLKGAVAFFGNSHSATNVARVRGAVARGFFTGLFTENKHKLGHAALRAKEQLYQEFPTNTSDYRGFNLFGDPDLSIWTATPRQLVVQHPTVILPQSQQLEITVNSDFAPVANALVCVSMSPSVYKYGYTDGQGVVTLSISPSDTGRLRLVVTGKNCHPYESYIQVTSQVAVTEPRPAAVGTGQVLVALPSTFTRTCRLNWSQPVQPGWCITVRSATGRLVREFQGLSGRSLAWDGKDAEGRSLGPGVYVCVLLDARGQVLGRTKLARVR